MLGFPGVAGKREGIIIRYVVPPAWLQPTTFGEPDGRLTTRLQSLVSLFRRAGLPVTASGGTRSWLTSHVAVVSPLANALYLAHQDPREAAGVYIGRKGSRTCVKIRLFDVAKSEDLGARNVPEGTAYR
jgi:2-dehydropantoate 2-reductase